jgi:hypothetical protein
MSWNANVVWKKDDKETYFKPEDKLEEYVETMIQEIIKFYEEKFESKKHAVDFNVDIEMNPGGKDEKEHDAKFSASDMKITIFYNNICDMLLGIDGEKGELSICLEDENYSNLCSEKDILKAKIAATLAHEMMHWFHYCDSHMKRCTIKEDYTAEDDDVEHEVEYEVEEEIYGIGELDEEAIAIKEAFAVYFEQCFIQYIEKDNAKLADFLIEIFYRPHRVFEEKEFAGKEKAKNLGDYICGEYLRKAGKDKIGKDCDIYNDIYKDYVEEKYKKGAEKVRGLKK